MSLRHMKIYGFLRSPILALYSLLVLSSISGCIDRSAYENTSLGSGQGFSIPLIDSKIGIASLAAKVNNGSASVKVSPDGKLTAFYNGEVVRNSSTELFPPLPGLTEFGLVDTTSLVPLPFDSRYTISKAVFGKTNIFFRLEEADLGTYNIKMTLPQLSKDGKVWNKTYNVDFTTPGQEIYTELSNLNGWTILPDDNKIKFVYEAYNSSGNRVKLDSIAMRVDQLVFDYVEGYFSKQVFELKGSNIQISLFDNWVSGGLDFDNPKMNISVENAFGFPVRSRFNKISLTTLGGQSFDLESQYINTGIDFDYPKINEVGEVKYSTFSFDKTNSNISDLFKEKIVSVTYDIDALANPDDDTSILNFVDTTSYFSVNVDIEIPLLGTANDFVMKQETDLDLSELADAESAIFKIIIFNDFPTDMLLQSYFKDAEDNILDSLFADGPLEIDSAQLGSDLKTTAPFEETSFEDISKEKMSRLLSAIKIENKISLDNIDSYNGNLWLYDNYEIGLKVGAIIKLK